MITDELKILVSNSCYPLLYLQVITNKLQVNPVVLLVLMSRAYFRILAKGGGKMECNGIWGAKQYGPPGSEHAFNKL